MSNLVEHAKRELHIIGQDEEDPGFADSLVRAVEAFASYGHSGGSAMIGADMLNRLLQFKALSPLGPDPSEWNEVDSGIDSERLWQNKRESSAFSKDHGHTIFHV